MCIPHMFPWACRASKIPRANLCADDNFNEEIVLLDIRAHFLPTEHGINARHSFYAPPECLIGCQLHNLAIKKTTWQ